MTVKITLELEPNHAAALHQVSRKMGHIDAMRFLQPHLGRELRSDQAYDIVHACAVLEQALADAGVNYWPWIESGQAGRLA